MTRLHHASPLSQHANGESADGRMKDLLDRISQAVLERAASNYPPRDIVPQPIRMRQSNAMVRLV